MHYWLKVVALGLLMLGASVAALAQQVSKEQIKGLIDGGVDLELGVVQHAYSHFKVTVHIFRCDFSAAVNGKNLKWVSVNKLDEYPMGKVDRRIAGMVKQ